MRLAPLLALCAAATTAAAQGRTVVEREPNEAPATALLVALGDTLTGAIDPRRDLDFFTFDVPAGTWLRLDRTGSYGSPTFSRIELNLIDVDGQSSLVWLLEEQEQLAVEYPITYGGRYYLLVRVWDHDDPSPSDFPTPQWTYHITISGSPMALAPGEPVTPVLSKVGALQGLVADSGGFLTLTDSGITRFSLDGAHEVIVPRSVLAVAGTWSSAGDQVAISGFGDFLVHGYIDPGQYVIWRISRDRERSDFASGPWLSPHRRMRLQVAADGDVWVGPASAPPAPAHLWRLSPFGEIRDSVDVEGLDVRALAFAPSRVLHFTGAGGVYRVGAGQQPEVVIAAAAGDDYQGLAFDRDGNLYVVRNGAVVLFSPGYQVLQDPLARHPLMSAIAFAPGTRHLVALVAWWKVGQLNPDGIRAPGAPVGGRLVRLSSAGRAGSVGEVYADTIRMPNAAPGVTWTRAWGVLPPGVTLDATSGALAGTPTQPGAFTFEIRATGASVQGYGRFTLTVGPAMSATLVADAVLDPAVAAGLPPEVFATLDVNQNGVIDVADMRAYVRSRPR